MSNKPNTQHFEPRPGPYSNSDERIAPCHTRLRYRLTRPNAKPPTYATAGLDEHLRVGRENWVEPGSASGVLMYVVCVLVLALYGWSEVRQWRRDVRAEREAER